MDNSSLMQPIVRKARKKKVKHEVDRIKQAEKKKRRLEKAIATSAAIRAELEKKKQMKKEGRLDAAVEEDSADAANNKQERDELECSKQAEKKNIRLEKPIATSAAIMAELEKKKLRKLEEQKRLDEEGAAIAERKKRRLEKAIATSAAIRTELEKKKQMKKEGQLDAAVEEDSAKNKQERDELERIKQAERKKRRLEKAIATSAAIRTELEKKKQMKKEGQLDAAVEEDSADAAKNKQERDELERCKQAEKKNIRLEKSIATSAAIMAELEKKKLRKLEEQKRLDEEGAAIAEKKKRRLEKAIATSAAIRAELEKKKQMKKEGQLDAAVEEDSAKNKQERDKLERIKQAERKKRRLEKSIATSAAIRAELEKKKLRKLEEQRRLDEEGAAIAEAVALHVLLGEDCDDSYRNTLNQETGFKPWDSTTKFNLFSGGRNIFFSHQRCSSYAVHSNNRTRESNWSSVSFEPSARGWDNNNNNMRISADLIAAQAVSSLQISENTHVDAIVFNGMFRR